MAEVNKGEQEYDKLIVEDNNSKLMITRSNQEVNNEQNNIYELFNMIK